MLKASETDWHKTRRKGLGGSDAGAVLGLSPWRSQMDVWLEKTGRAAPFEGNEATYWGRRLESLVADKYSEETSAEVRRVNTFIYSEAYPMLFGNIDRAVCTPDAKMPVVRGKFKTNKILECKTARAKNEDWGRAGTDEIPDYYILQCMQYLGLTGCSTCDLAVLFLESRKFEIYKIDADPDFTAQMFVRLADWWEKYVVKDVAPPARTVSDVQKLFKRSAQRTLVATSEIEDLARCFYESKKRATALEAEIEEAKNGICVFMQDADTLLGADGRPLITWKSRVDGIKTDWQQVAIEAGANQDLIAKHTKTVPGARTFLTKMKN